MIRRLTEQVRSMGRWTAQRRRSGYWLAAGIAAFYALVLWRDPLGNPTLLATMAFSTATAIFSYFAYRFSKEKFRLDLFDRRFAVYEATLEFCSRATAHGSLRALTPEQREAAEQAIRAAEGSFRGIGWHKTKALFGEDIHKLFSKLNKSYAWLSAFGGGPGNSMAHEQWGREYTTHTEFIWDTVNRLPDLFRAYVYFGDYRRD
jgi:hypothetical protein